MRPSPLELTPTPDALPPGGGVLVGFSGGLDSSVLLHRLAADPAARARGLRAIHVHHGLHPGAEAWAAHCQRTCAMLGVPLGLVRVTVDRTQGLGPEGAARAARYRALAAAMGVDGIVALAHHRDDQAETFLLRALRGAGVDGLGAMRAWRRFEHGWLWRPLLGVARAELLAYARAQGLAWVEDPSNADEGADRNFLRLRVLPLLRERWPHADDALARSAALAAQAGGLLACEDAAALEGARLQPDTLRVDALLRLPGERRARVLRRWVHDLALPPLPARALARIDALLADGPGEVAWSGARARRWRDLLHAGPPPAALPANWECDWDGRQPLSLPTGDVLELAGAAGFDMPLRARARRGGERIALPGRGHSHALKHMLQDAGVPPWLRARLPLLCAPDGQVLAAGDAIVSASLHAWLQARGATLRWRHSAIA